MSIHALSIHPAEPNWVPDLSFEPFLRRVGFLGEVFDFYGTRCFRPGERFFDHIVFHHSHSVIELTPTEDGLVKSEPRDSRSFCRIELDTGEKTGFLCGCNVRDPKCPACSYTIADWPEMLGNWFNENRDWSCPECGRSCPACEVDWQNVAGASRFWINVRQIHEGDAVPSDEFLRALADETSCQWRYFWYHL